MGDPFNSTENKCETDPFGFETPVHMHKLDIYAARYQLGFDAG
jgi:hypothetical protein